MSAGTWDLLFFMVAFLAAVGTGIYYILGVLDGDRALSRAAAVGCFVFGAIAAVSLVRVVW